MKHQTYWFAAFVLLVLVLVNVTGCFPDSCQRRVSQSLLPSDSLSRQLASIVPLDTLDLLHRASGTTSHPLVFPRTVAFSQNSSARIFVSDVERNSLFVFTSDGAFVREINHDSFDLPFLAGWRGDTLAVFNPPSLLTLFIFENEVIRSVSTPPDIIDDRPLLYTTVSSDHIFVKAVGRGKKGHILTLDNHGRIKERHTLEQPYWRYAGFLRMWGDSLLSLSGFRPVIDVSYHGTSLDTLALRGFDSPMLGRSRAYMMGEVLQAPLLTPSAAPAGDLLFVLNLRTGWLRVDVFDRQGRLLHRLIEPDPVPNSNFFPQDIAVRRRDDSVYEIAVVLNEPTPRLDLYGWNPESALSRAD